MGCCHGRRPRPWPVQQLMLLATSLLGLLVFGASIQPCSAARVRSGSLERSRGYRAASDISHSQLRLEPCYPPPCPGYSLGHLHPWTATDATANGFADSLDSSMGAPSESVADPRGTGEDPNLDIQPQPVDEQPHPDRPQSLDDAVLMTAPAPEDDTDLLNPDHYLVRVLHAPPVLMEPALPPEAVRAVNEIQRLDKLIAAQRADIERRQLWLNHAREALQVLQSHMDVTRRAVNHIEARLASARRQQASIRERLARDELMDQLDASQARLNALLEQEEPLKSKTSELRDRQTRLQTVIQELQEGHELLRSRLNPRSAE